ncbi:MAG: sodium:solute symporter [Bacteroidota bacterium]|nr:sodium:solute symporter [Bacteroidota bacterium]MDP4275520.1 sodium:solute symporter [Bacteroidota bacterium]
MAALDWIILLIFFVCLMGIVFWVLKRKKDDTSDYFLSGRSETWLAVGAAIFAANIGSEHLVGLAGAGAESGMAMAHWEMQGWMILILGWVFVPFYAHSRVFTMPEFLKLRFNKSTSSTLSVITLISYVLTKVSVTAFTGGIFLQSVMGIDFWYGAIGLVLLTGIFTVLGGMKGIMTISVVQAPILIAGAITILILGLLKAGGGCLLDGWQAVVKFAGNNIHLIHPKGDPLYDNFPGVSVFFGASIIGFWYWCTDQHIVQRALASKNLNNARKGTIFAGFLKILPVFMFLIPGMIAAALRAKGILLFSDNNEAYGSLVGYLLPMGIKGIVVVGFIAALMTSLAAHFNSSATLFTIDFYKNYHPTASEHRLVWIGRVATVTVVLLGLIWIPIMKTLGSVLYEYLQKVQSLIAPAIAAVFLMGVFNRKITPKAGQWGLLIGFLIGMFRLGLMIFDPGTHYNAATQKLITDPALRYGLFKILDLNWIHFCIILFFLTMAIMAVISMFTKRAGEEQLKGLTYFSQTPEQRAETKNSWSKWDVLTSLVVVAFCIGFYIYFW